ncbi:hypothetical protein CDEST_11110 [Colletotrichum destructivum]|uniref:Uncharacterized protein n=1 Tax=Colletotrichum destructivum TaxID=34406 RepID=A0AAX4ISB3_9PEZI|nr:hypothetical protein CDEST_11110 [Colletotrichum destructivum]
MTSLPFLCGVSQTTPPKEEPQIDAESSRFAMISQHILPIPPSIRRGCYPVRPGGANASVRPLPPQTKVS